MKENKTDIQKQNNNSNNSSNYIKPTYNIDLFTKIQQIENDDTEPSNSIYLKFYNEHTRKKVLQNQTNSSILNNKYFDENLECIKKKETKFKRKKSEEEKIQIEKEKEKNYEFRQNRMKKMYSSKNILNNNNNKIIHEKSEIDKCKNKKLIKRSNSMIFKRKNSSFDYSHKKINLNKSIEHKKQQNKNLNKSMEVNNNKNKIDTKGYKAITRIKYNKKIRTMTKLSEFYKTELEFLKNEKHREIVKEKELKLLLDSILEEIYKYKQKIGIIVLD